LTQTRPTLSVFPSSDRAFRALAEAWLETFGDDPERLQGQLRKRYPRAIVRQRDLSQEPLRIWYVYRDGSVMGPHGPAGGT
jgi:hypothetical protein